MNILMLTLHDDWINECVLDRALATVCCCQLLYGPLQMCCVPRLRFIFFLSNFHCDGLMMILPTQIRCDGQRQEENDGQRRERFI